MTDGCCGGRRWMRPDGAGGCQWRRSTGGALFCLRPYSPAASVGHIGDSSSLLWIRRRRHHRLEVGVERVVASTSPPLLRPSVHGRRAPSRRSAMPSPTGGGAAARRIDLLRGTCLPLSITFLTKEQHEDQLAKIEATPPVRASLCVWINGRLGNAVELFDKMCKKSMIHGSVSPRLRASFLDLQDTWCSWQRILLHLYSTRPGPPASSKTGKTSSGSRSASRGNTQLLSICAVSAPWVETTQTLFCSA